MPSSPTPSHHHDRGLLLVLILLLAAAVASRGDDDNDAHAASSACRPYLCGGVNITYPFHRASDGGESYCGYPGLAVTCDGGGDKPVLKLGDDSYTVSGIDYANLIVSLADAEYAAGNDNGGCPVVDHNVTIPPALWLSIILHSVDYLFFFVGCSFGPEAEPVPRPPKPPTIKPITCGDDLDDKPPASMTFVLPRGEVPPGDWSTACRQVFEVPVLKNSIPPNAEDPLWRKEGYGKALRAGFQLGWDRSSGGGPCGQCEQSSGKCGYNGAGAFLGCLCADGRVGDGGSCSKISADSSSALSWPGT